MFSLRYGQDDKFAKKKVAGQLLYYYYFKTLLTDSLCTYVFIFIIISLSPYLQSDIHIAAFAVDVVGI